MKTNHQRGFKAEPESKRQQRESPVEHFEEGRQSYWGEQLELSGKAIQTYIHPGHTHDSEEKCRRGAKRRINRVARKLENSATKKLAEKGDDE